MDTKKKQFLAICEEIFLALFRSIPNIFSTGCKNKANHFREKDLNSIFQKIPVFTPVNPMADSVNHFEVTAGVPEWPTYN
jgi:hypothetical protein